MSEKKGSPKTDAMRKQREEAYAEKEREASRNAKGHAQYAKEPLPITPTKKGAKKR